MNDDVAVVLMGTRSGVGDIPREILTTEDILFIEEIVEFFVVLSVVFGDVKVVLVEIRHSRPLILIECGLTSSVGH